MVVAIVRKVNVFIRFRVRKVDLFIGSRARREGGQTTLGLATARSRREDDFKGDVLVCVTRSHLTYESCLNVVQSRQYLTLYCPNFY